MTRVQTCALPIYFDKWLAGFVEAEGCFSSRKAGNFSFSIAQKFDYYLIYAIRNFYGLDHLKIFNKTASRPQSDQGVAGDPAGKVSNEPVYEFSVGSIYGVERVINHCQSMLQGYKYYQLAVFVNNSGYFSNRSNEFWNTDNSEPKI